MTKLNADTVHNIFLDCLFKDSEITKGQIPDNAIMVEGIVHKFGFHRERVFEHADEIFALLKELPVEFMQSGGGGMSFLQACNDKDGVQWTGLHAVMEQLFCLGIAIDKVQIQLPRSIWSSLPGGMPYLVVYDT